MSEALRKRPFPGTSPSLHLPQPVLSMQKPRSNIGVVIVRGKDMRHPKGVSMNLDRFTDAVKDDASRGLWKGFCREEIGDRQESSAHDNDRQANTYKNSYPGMHKQRVRSEMLKTDSMYRNLQGYSTPNSCPGLAASRLRTGTRDSQSNCWS